MTIFENHYNTFEIQNSGRFQTEFCHYLVCSKRLPVCTIYHLTFGEPSTLPGLVNPGNIDSPHGTCNPFEGLDRQLL